MRDGKIVYKSTIENVSKKYILAQKHPQAGRKGSKDIYLSTQHALPSPSLRMTKKKGENHALGYE